MGRERILLVEDDHDLVYAFCEFVDGEAEVVWASTQEAAVEEFSGKEPGYYSAIVVDACVPGNTPNTQALIARFRGAGFEGPILGTSTNPEYLQGLRDAGADAAVEKNRAALSVLELLTTP